MVDLRFILVGFRSDKGYGIKDLEDEMVEYFSKEELLGIAKNIKISGVDDSVIDLEWFRDYYAKYVLSFGTQSAINMFGICINNVGKFEYNYESHGFCNFKFIEFVDDYDINSDLSVLLFSYLGHHDSTLFHLHKKFDSMSGYLTAMDDAHLKLDVGNILIKGAVVSYFCGSSSVTVIKDLRMKGVRYGFLRCKDVYLVNIPVCSHVHLSFSFSGCLCISKECNISDITFRIIDNAVPVIFLEDMTMRGRINKLFILSGYKLNLIFRECTFIYDGDDVTVR